MKDLEKFVDENLELFNDAETGSGSFQKIHKQA